MYNYKSALISNVRPISEFAICHVVRHGNVNSIQNPPTVTNPTMESYILLPLIYVVVPYNVTNRKLTRKYWSTDGLVGDVKLIQLRVGL